MSNGKGQALGSIFGDRGRPAARAAASGIVLPTGRTVAPALTAFLAVVDRLEAVLDAETAALGRNLPADMTEFGNRKRQGLLEMTRSLRAAAAAGAGAEIRERLGRFAATLERNRAALGTQLHAAREIAEIIAHTLKEADSDGTYSLRVGRS